MKRIITLMVMVFLMGNMVAQEKQKEEFVVNHTVELGETVLMICKKYVVLPADFYKYNKEAINGIKTGEALRVPLHLSKKKNAIEIYQKNLRSSYATVEGGKPSVKVVEDGD